MAQKTNTASEFTHRFSTVEGFFATQKYSILVTHRFSMYAWVTNGEKEINEIMSTHMIPRCFPQIFHIWKTYGIFIQ